MALQNFGSSLGLGYRTLGLGLLSVAQDPRHITEADQDKDQLVAVQRELGLAFEDKRTDNILKAFLDPQTAHGEYMKARKPIDASAANVLKDTYAACKKAGLPEETCLQYARKRAIVLHDLDDELLNLTHPFAASADSLLSLAAGAKRQGHIKKKNFVPPPPDPEIADPI